MPDAESRAARNRITADDPASNSAPEGARPPDRSAAEDDPGITSHSVAIRRGQSITDSTGSSLVTRGLQDIAELRAREELSACIDPEDSREPAVVSPEQPSHRATIRELKAAAEREAAIALEEFVALLKKKGLLSDPEPESTAADSPKPTPPPPAPPAEQSPLPRRHPEELLRQGNGYLRKGQFREAAACFTKAIELKPDFAEAYRNRGFTHVCDFDKAVADHTEAIRLRPEFVEAYCDQVDAYSKSTDFDVAIAVNSRTIMEEPENGLARYNRGHAYEGRGSLDKAIVDYTCATQLDPTDAETYCGRGRAYKKKGDHFRAIADYSRAIQLDPGYAVAFCSRGLAYEAKADFDKAIADYTEAIRLSPTFVLAYFCRSYAYKKRGESERSTADTDKALELASQAIENYRRHAADKPASFWSDMLETIFGPLR